MAFTGIKRNYCASEGGIDHVLIYDQNDVNLNIAISSGVVVGMTEELDRLTCYKLEPHRGMGFFNESGTGSYENKTFFYTQEISIKGLGNDHLVKDAMAFIQKKQWGAIVVFNNGVSEVAGIDSGLFCEASTDESSEALGDSIAFSVTLKSPEESEKAPVISGSSRVNPYGDVANDLTIVAFA